MRVWVITVRVELDVVGVVGADIAEVVEHVVEDEVAGAVTDVDAVQVAVLDLAVLDGDRGDDRLRLPRPQTRSWR